MERQNGEKKRNGLLKTCKFSQRKKAISNKLIKQNFFDSFVLFMVTYTNHTREFAADSDDAIRAGKVSVPSD